MKRYVSEDALDMKQDVPKLVVTAGSQLTLEDNTEYRLQNVSTLAVLFPQGNFDAWMRVNFAASGNVSLSMPSSTQYIGAAPAFKAGETWELSIKDGVAICWRVA